jgi:superfamily I DNA and/or RNA helicase
VIVELMRAGKKVGVAANSHKAINNLLTKIENRAEEIGFKFRGIKKSTETGDTLFKGRFIRDVTDNKEVDSSANLIAGTAWLFARQELDQELDYLFIDEAGQVSLANLVAMGLSARNIVLVGDQMQLAQPIQGVHPGESGLSVLDYLLQDAATIAPEKGIFLPTTWRMHEDVCRFISDVVYDGRLHPEQKNQNRRVILSAGAYPALASTGIRFVPVEYAGCSQKSEEEGRVIRDLFESLICQSYSDREGRDHPFRMENILVVAPYNVQVNYLKSILPDGARVGTVDKFQGQEAEVVLISMTTSGAEDMPRNIEFLYSKNRLNVAISRARCLAIVVANPRLLEIPCQTVEQMQLVNTLCRAAAYSGT